MDLSHDEKEWLRLQAKKESMRTIVRVVITLAAGLYIFVGPGIIIGLLVFGGENLVKDASIVFGLSSGLAGTVVGYWFNERTHARMRHARESEE